MTIQYKNSRPQITYATECNIYLTHESSKNISHHPIFNFEHIGKNNIPTASLQNHGNN